MQLTARAADLASSLVAARPGLFSAHPLPDLIRRLDAVPRSVSYNKLPASVEETWGSIRRELGADDLRSYQAATMASLIADFERRVAPLPVPKSVRDLFPGHFERILAQIESDPDPASFEGEDFLKDLGLCRTTLLPAGAQVINESPTLSRSLVYRSGVAQFARFTALLLFVTRGSGPFYQFHTHSRNLEDFNEEGWERCYLRVAELLALNPRIKGIYGATWFYDPEISRISPRLAYLRGQALERGGASFYVGPDPGRLAIEKSKTRRDLYEKGEYVPTSYLIVLPRKGLLAWAEGRRGRA